MTSSGRKILEHAQECGRETMLGLSSRQRFLPGLADGTPKEVRGDAQIGLVRVRARQSHQRLGAQVAGGRRRESLLQ